MGLTFYQRPRVRECAQALMTWLIEAEGPGATLADLADVVLSCWAQRQGIALPDVATLPSAGAPPDVVALLGADYVCLPDDPRIDALIAALDYPLSIPTPLEFRLAGMWARAVESLWGCIAQPSSDEDLGPRYSDPETVWLWPGQLVPECGIWRRVDEYVPPHTPALWERAD